jgi:hypothetical protein
MNPWKTKWIALATSGGVWLVAVGSAAALVYKFNPPAELPGAGYQMASPIVAKHATVKGAVEEATVNVLRVPPVTIFGRYTPPPPRPATGAAPRDIREMQCSEWRELQAGSGSVQICQ